jgi:dihydroorotase-like cyclic amidohydrolase
VTDLVVKNAHVLDPSTNLDGVADVRITGGRISEVGTGLRGGRELDADELHLLPGFVDVHAHWRTPGREDEEDIETGSAAAAAGGFTSIVMMPNTDPVVDKPVIVSGLVRRVERESRVRAYVSAALHAGLPGIPASAEDVATATALVLAAETGAKVHVTHVSTGLSAVLVGFFKARADVTADTTPHHTTLTDELVSTLDGLYRVNPPLRPASHRDGVTEALRDGILDFVATDHAPHVSEEKELPLEEAAPGFLGHETAFAAMHTELVLSGKLSLPRLVEAMACAPGRWLNGTGRVAVGVEADLALVDLSEEWTVGRDTLLSKSSNSPYAGKKLTGRVVGTIVRGELVHDRTGEKLGVRA